MTNVTVRQGAVHLHALLVHRITGLRRTTARSQLTATTRLWERGRLARSPCPKL
jgi:hypothetical protein